MAENAISLDGLSVSDLAALQAKIAEQIKARKEESKQEAKDKILSILAEYSFSMADLFPLQKGGQEAGGVQKKKVKVKCHRNKRTHHKASLTNASQTQNSWGILIMV